MNGRTSRIAHFVCVAGSLSGSAPPYVCRRKNRWGYKQNIAFALLSDEFDNSQHKVLASREGKPELYERRGFGEIFAQPEPQADPWRTHARPAAWHAMAGESQRLHVNGKFDPSHFPKGLTVAQVPVALSSADSYSEARELTSLGYYKRLTLSIFYRTFGSLFQRKCQINIV